MTKKEYTEKIKEIIQASHDCAEWNCWEDHQVSINDLLSLIPDLVRSFLSETGSISSRESSKYIAGHINGHMQATNQIEDRLKTWESEGK